MGTKKKDTRQEVLNATGLLFSKQGYHGTSMSDIAKKVGIGKSALYYHFESKDALCRKLMQGSFNKLKIKLKRAVKDSLTPFDVLFNVIKTLLDFRLKHPELNLLTGVNLSSDEKEPIVQFIADLRIKLLKFIRELIGDVDFVRRKGQKFLFVFSASLLSFVLSPLIPDDMKSSEVSEQMIQVIVGKKENSYV